MLPVFYLAPRSPLPGVVRTWPPVALFLGFGFLFTAAVGSVHHLEVPGLTNQRSGLHSPTTRHRALKRNSTVMFGKRGYNGVTISILTTLGRFLIHASTQ